MSPERSIVRSTWRALLAPRRLLPILVVCAPLIATQAAWSRDRFAVPLGIAMCIAFVGLAPVSYRVLFPDGLDFSHGAVRVVLYTLTGAGVMLSLGAGVPKLLGMNGTFLTNRLSLAVSIALFLVGGWGLARDIGFEQRVERLTAEAERARLLALRAHLDPHFLFNTLNAIAEWCRTDGVVAEAAVLKLSAMLRTVIDGTQVASWPLERELQLVKTLFDLHLMRDPSHFTLEFHSDPRAVDVEVPALSLLTLAENAMKHGPGKGHRGVVRLHVHELEAAVVVVLENPGPFTGERVGGLGLATVQRQLAQFAPGPGFGGASLDIRDLDTARTRATVSFHRTTRIVNLPTAVPLVEESP